MRPSSHLPSTLLKRVFPIALAALVVVAVLPTMASAQGRALHIVAVLGSNQFALILVADVRPAGSLGPTCSAQVTVYNKNGAQISNTAVVPLAGETHFARVLPSPDLFRAKVQIPARCSSVIIVSGQVYDLTTFALVSDLPSIELPPDQS